MIKKLRPMWIVVGAAVILIIACVILIFGRPYKTISMEAAVKMMESESGYIIVDVRTPEEYQEGHIPNAVNVPLEGIMEDDVENALPDKNQVLMVYCYTGRRSAAASEKLANMGYQNIYNIGGIVDWPGEKVK